MTVVWKAGPPPSDLEAMYLNTVMMTRTGPSLLRWPGGRPTPLSPSPSLSHSLLMTRTGPSLVQCPLTLEDIMGARGEAGEALGSTLQVLVPSSQEEETIRSLQEEETIRSLTSRWREMGWREMGWRGLIM